MELLTKRLTVDPTRTLLLNHEMETSPINSEPQRIKLPDQKTSSIQLPPTREPGNGPDKTFKAQVTC